MSADGARELNRDPELGLNRPELIELLAYWEAKRGDRQFPRRADISPRDLPRQLPWLHMYDVCESGTEFRFRLIGTTLASFFPQQDARGESITILPLNIYQRLQEALLWVVRNRAPLRTFNPSSTIPGQSFQGSESCFLPLSTNDSDIDIIVAATMLEKRK